MTTPNKLPFLDAEGVMLMDQIPAYPGFQKKFQQPMNKKLLQLLAEDDVKITLSDGSVVDRIHETQKTQLRKLIKNISKNGKLTVFHSESDHHGQQKTGRQYSPGSLIPLSKIIKHTMMAYDGWIDLDMPKGHPSIAVSVCEMFGITLHHMLNYITNADAICKELLEYYRLPKLPKATDPLVAEDFKDLFNMHLYGGNFSAWLHDLHQAKPTKNKLPKEIANKHIHPLITNFAADQKILTDFILKSQSLFHDTVKEFPELSPAATLVKNQRTVLSRYLTIIENHCLYVLFTFLKRKNYLKGNTCMLEYDGLCVPPEGFFDLNTMIREANAEVLAKTGLRYVKYTYKAYKEKNIARDIIAKLESAMEVEENTPRCVHSDTDASDVLYKIYPHWKYCLGVLYVFNFDTGMWNSDKNSHQIILRKFSDHLYVPVEGDDTKRSKKSYGNDTVLMGKILSIMGNLCVDNQWLLLSQKSARLKLLFTNGYWDAQRDQFIPAKSEVVSADGSVTIVNGYRPELVFFGRIPLDYIPETEATAAQSKSVKQRLFINPLGQEIGTFWLQRLAMALMGHVTKHMYFAVGVTDAGKSLITNALLAAGGDYVKTFNAGNLAHSNSTIDEAQKMRPFFLLPSARLALSNEMSAMAPLDCNMIKKLTGGDNQIGRVHGGLETEFTINFMCVVFCNAFSSIVPIDNAVINRCNVVEYMRQCVSDPDPNDLANQMQGDPNLGAEILTEEFRRAFLHLLIKSYSRFLCKGPAPIPEKVQCSSEDWIGKKDDCVERFFETFTASMFDSEYITCEGLKRWVDEEAKLKCGYVRFTKDLKKYCEKHYPQVKSEVRKLGLKSVRVWVCLKRS